MKQRCINLRLIFLGLVVSAGCGGCAGFAWHNPNLTLYGPMPILDDTLETIDLKTLMSFGDANSPEISNWDAAFAAFDSKANSLPGTEKEKIDEQKKLRNEVQDRIVAASNQRCGEYKNFLKRFDSETNTILGGLATAIGGAGAIFKPAGTARALSGVAAIFSGWRAEVNADFFNNLAIQVVTKGIEARRTELFTQMLKNRDADLVTYSVQRAVGDAAVYHYNCSLIAGLEKAAESIERAQNPGWTEFSKGLDNFKDARDKIDGIVRLTTPPSSPTKSGDAANTSGN